MSSVSGDTEGERGGGRGVKGGEGERGREGNEKGEGGGHLIMDAFWRGHAAKTGFLKRPAFIFHAGKCKFNSTFSSCKNVNIANSLVSFISGHFDIRILDIRNLI
jgi:hypothetical protein